MSPPDKAVAAPSVKEGAGTVRGQEGPTAQSPEFQKGRGVCNRVAFLGMVLVESRAETPQMRQTAQLVCAMTSVSFRPLDTIPETANCEQEERFITDL